MDPITVALITVGGVFVLILLGVHIGVALALRPRSGPSGRALWKLGLVVLVPGLAAAAALETWGRGIGPLARALATFTQVQAAGEGRRLWWSTALRMVVDHPLAGVGEGRFRVAYPPYQARVLASLPDPDRLAVAAATVESPHNDYLQIAAELGIPGLLLLGGALALLLRDGTAAARQAQGTERAWRAGCLGGLVGVLTAGMVGYPLHTASGLYMAVSMAALAVVTPAHRGTAPAAAPRWQWWLLVVVTALGFWQSARLLQTYAASLHLHRGSEALLRRDLPAAMDALERAHQVSPRDSQVRLALGRAYGLNGRPDLALSHLRAGLHGFDGAPLRTLLGNAHALLGQDQMAEEMFRVGVTWFPGGYAPLHTSYARFLAARDRPGEAARELSRALATDPNLAEAHYLLSYLRAGSGDQAGAAAALRRFLDLATPGDPRLGAVRTLLRSLEGHAVPH